MYVGMQDFWIDSLTGKLSLSVKHATRATVFTRGQNTLVPSYPSVSLSVRDFHLKIRSDGMTLKGERGTKVPDMKVLHLVCVCVCVCE